MQHSLPIFSSFLVLLERHMLIQIVQIAPIAICYFGGRICFCSSRCACSQLKIVLKLHVWIILTGLFSGGTRSFCSRLWWYFGDFLTGLYLLFRWLLLSGRCFHHFGWWCCYDGRSLCDQCRIMLNGCNYWHCLSRYGLDRINDWTIVWRVIGRDDFGIVPLCASGSLDNNWNWCFFFFCNCPDLGGEKSGISCGLDGMDGMGPRILSLYL